MCDVALKRIKPQIIERRCRQRKSMLLEEPLAPGRVRKAASAVEAYRIEGRVGQIRLQKGVAMLDLRPLGHFTEEPPRSRAGEKRTRVIDKGMVRVECGHGRADLVDVG